MSESGKILVVDDDEAFAETYAQLLGLEGYQVVVASSVEEARGQLARGRWDVVLLDQKLQGPGGGDEGLSLIGEIAATGAHVIVATGYASPETIQRAFRDGAYDYLEKGPNLSTFLRVKVRNAADAVRERRMANLNDREKEEELLATWREANAATDSNVKGERLEHFIFLLCATIPGFERVDTNRNNRLEEIDVLVQNHSTDAFWAKERSPYILIECKNWSKPVGKNELVLFRAKLERRWKRATLGLFVALGGFTKTFHEENLASREKDALVIALGREDIESLIASNDRNSTLKRLHARAVVGEKPAE